MNQKYGSLFERLVANSAEPDSPTGCWIWTGQSCGHHGQYGKLTMRIDGKHCKVWSHREMEHCMRGVNEFDLDDDPLGPILIVERPRLTEDETIDHLCGNTLCINPDHWAEPISRVLNSKLRWERRR